MFFAGGHERLAIVAIHPAPGVRALIDELTALVDDGSATIQEVVGRIPACISMDRAYVAQLSPDGNRFAVTQASTSARVDLLGYTQSVARLPALVRRCLTTGSQGTIGDTATFPFTPQQRAMLFYDGVGATIVTPISAGGSVIGALVADAYRGPRAFTATFLAAVESLAAAIGRRLLLARSGAHLSDEPASDDSDRIRQNIFAKLAAVLQRSSDPAATSRAVVQALEELPGVTAVSYITAPSGAALEALSTESLLTRVAGGTAAVVVPLVLQGERFGAIELVLAGERLSAADEQFLRTVGVFASSAFASALRRRRPRDESLVDPVSGLLNYRAIHEVLVEAAALAKAERQPLAVWLVEIDGLVAIDREQGYAVGDDIVGYVGHVLEGAVVPRGTAGRHSGATFLGVFPKTTPEEATTAARILAERIARQTPAHLPPFALSAGVASLPSDAYDPDELVRYARLALYAAKRVEGTRVVAAQSADPIWEKNARASLANALLEQLAPRSSARSLSGS